MSSFAAWLRANRNQYPALAPLMNFATANADRWPYWSDDAIDYIGVIRATNPALPPDQEQALIQTLVDNYAQWKTSQSSRSFLQLIGDNLGKIVLVGFGIYFAYLLQKGLLLETLDNADQVRGMVTFFFVLVTTSIILLVALGIFWLQDDAAVKVRFESAKDLLTLVIGVLGTIMGFYFGSATSGTANLALLNTSLTPPVLAAGQTATLVSQINGGARPYKYSVLFSDQNGAQIEGLANITSAESPDGKINKSVEIPKSAKPGVIFFTLTATDKNNINAQGGGAMFVQQPAAAQAPAARDTPATPPAQPPASPPTQPAPAPAPQPSNQ